ncbi:MAG: 4-hydroxy-tetrahydrodipicolinate reductase [Proteobacteria bacterium]|nr:4-hydroxy-tetrahydrodipicolinate reductase [Pseudomonadota bacterium]
MAKKRIAISGGLGRMGQMTLVEIYRDGDVALSGVLVRPGDKLVGAPVLFPETKVGTGQNYSDDRLAVFGASDVVIDFTTPKASVENAKAAAQTGAALVIGTTGFTEDQLEQIRAYAEKAPVLLSYNMSFAITALAKAVGGLSRALGPDFHLEITDIHHAEKKDKPSGTALLLGAASGRDKKDIKYTSHREGKVIGEHHILFSGPGEQIEIIHRARDRRLFARGGLLAADWLIGKQPGFYTLKDVMKI